MKLNSCIRFAILFASTFAVAHGNYQHVMGTVTKISQDSVTVRTTENSMVEVTISPDTKFSKADVAVVAQELRVGDRVVIHATKTSDGKLVAQTVQIGIAKPATASY